MNDVNSLSHSKWRCKYHIAFAPEYLRMAIYKQVKTDISVSYFMGYLIGARGVNSLTTTSLFLQSPYSGTVFLQLFTCCFYP